MKHKGSINSTTFGEAKRDRGVGLGRHHVQVNKRNDERIKRWRKMRESRDPVDRAVGKLMQYVFGGDASA